jgi:hypothetical protein
MAGTTFSATEEDENRCATVRLRRTIQEAKLLRGQGGGASDFQGIA